MVGKYFKMNLVCFITRKSYSVLKIIFGNAADELHMGKIEVYISNFQFSYT